MDKKTNLFIEVAMKTMAAITITYFAVRIFQSYQFRPNNVLLLLLLGEIITISLVIVAKPTDTRDFSITPVLLTVAGTFCIILVSLDTGIQLVPRIVSQTIMVIGICWQILSKIYLGRSFGLLPAHRSVVDTGPYRLIRHPIYFGYFINHVGFLLNQFSLYHLMILTIVYLFQFGRMYYEEKTLSRSEEYRQYKERVKKRFIPFVI